jgi:transcriptional regulator with XRE-family HTH domain
MPSQAQELAQLRKMTGARIRSLCKQRGWSQEDLAANSGLPSAHVAMIERGEKTVRVSTLGKIAKAFKMTLSDLMQGMPDPMVERRNLGNRIRFLRRARGWSQEDLHRRTGLSRAFAGAIERGECDMGMVTLYKLAKAFRITLSELLETVDDSTARRH